MKESVNLRVVNLAQAAQTKNFIVRDHTASRDQGGYCYHFLAVN